MTSTEMELSASVLLISLLTLNILLGITAREENSKDNGRVSFSRYQKRLKNMRTPGWSNRSPEQFPRLLQEMEYSLRILEETRLDSKSRWEVPDYSPDNSLEESLFRAQKCLEMIRNHGSYYNQEINCRNCDVIRKLQALLKEITFELNNLIYTWNWNPPENEIVGAIPVAYARRSFYKSFDPLTNENGWSWGVRNMNPEYQLPSSARFPTGRDYYWAEDYQQGRRISRDKVDYEPYDFYWRRRDEFRPDPYGLGRQEDRFNYGW